MNPETNKLEAVFDLDPGREEDRAKIQRMLEKAKYANTPGIMDPPEKRSLLVRADGSPVPEHWPIFKVDEEVVVKSYRFRVGYINETTLVLEPVGPVLVGNGGAP